MFNVIGGEGGGFKSAVLVYGFISLTWQTLVLVGVTLKSIVTQHQVFPVYVQVCVVRQCYSTEQLYSNKLMGCFNLINQ